MPRSTGLGRSEIPLSPARARHRGWRRTSPGPRYRLSRGYTHYRPIETRTHRPDVGNRPHSATPTAPRSSRCSAPKRIWICLWSKPIGVRSMPGRWRAASVLPRRRRGKPGWGPAPAARRRQCPGADTAGGLGRGRGPVWSWGITELRGPRTPDRYLLYLVIDVYSRYPITWCIEYPESAQRAVELFTATIGKHGPARAARRQRERRCARRDYWTCSRTKACSRRSRGPGQRRQPVLRVAVQDTQARPVLPAAVRLDRPRAPMDRRFPAPVFHRAPRDRIVRSVPCSPPGTVATGLSAVPSATSVRRRNRCRPTAASSS